MHEIEEFESDLERGSIISTIEPKKNVSKYGKTISQHSSHHNLQDDDFDSSSGKSTHTYDLPHS